MFSLPLLSCRSFSASLSLITALLLSGVIASAQVRPVPPIVTPPGGGGGGNNPGGGGGGGNNPGGGINPGGPGTLPIVPPFPSIPDATGPRIATASGILVGQTAQASVILPTTAPTSGGSTTPASTYQWTISGGKITGDPTRQSITFIADAPGTLSLNVVVTTAGSGLSTSTDVVVLSPVLAGAISAAASVTTGSATFSASVPAAQNADRSFRWSVLGSGASIVGSTTGNTVNIRPGAPGLLEVLCDITLQQLATVTLRSFVNVAGAGAPVPLTVEQGSGSGTYPAGSRIDIFALPPAPGQIFHRWTGDTSLLGDSPLAPFQPHATVTLPTTPSTLVATYRATPSWTPASVTNFNPIPQTNPNGTLLLHHLPADARAVVFLLHDTGGSASTWFSSPEQLTLARDLVAAGYGVAALSSTNRTTAAWSTQPTLAANPDASTLLAAVDRVAAGRPVFFLGFAAGADAATRYADLLAPSRPVRAVISYCSPGGDALPVTTRLPQFFALASHDPLLGSNGNTAARNAARLLLGRGIPATVLTNPASPLPPARLRSLALTSSTFTADDAQTIWNSLKTAGLLDANSYPKSAPSTDTVRAALPAAHQSRAPDVAAQLAVAYAAQEFYSDANPALLAFLDARLADTLAATTPGRLVNLSTRGKISHLGDTLTLGFNLTGPQRATLLIRGIGPTLARFGLNTALPAPRLEVRRASTLLAANEGWDDRANNPAAISAATASVAAFPLAPGSLDTALLLTLEPGAYTVTLRGINGTIGDTLAEIYDISRNATRLSNLSVLSKISAPGDLLLAGFVLAGPAPRTLLARSVAQSLRDLGLPADYLLGDANLAVYDGSRPLAANNNWIQGPSATLTAAFPAVGAFPLRATSDAALLDALPPGAYTLQAGAAPGTGPAASQTGTLLVELYEVP